MTRRYRIPRLVPDGSGARVATEPPRRKREGRRADSERLDSEPWRRGGYGLAYRKARQLVMERQRGRCAGCGRVVAEKGRDGWRSTLGGQVHHRTPLAEGGTDDPANLVLLCPSCHALEDARRRRERDGG